MKNDKIKVVFVTPSLSGGAEKNIVNIINLLDLCIYDVTLIVCGKDLSYLSLLPVEIKTFFLKKENVRTSWFKVFKIIQNFKPDIVYTTANQLSIPVQFFKIFTFGKYIDVARLPSLPSNGLGVTLKDKMLKMFEGYVYRRVSKVVAQSAQMATEISRFYKVREKKIIVIPNPVNKKQVLALANAGDVEFDKRDFNVVAVGTLYSVKGLDLLIEAINILKQTIADIKLHIVGKEGIEVGYRQFLESRVTDLGLKSHVVFHGYETNPYRFIKNANLFVLSSRKEGFPNVVLEALTIGTPVVVTNCVDFGGIIEEGCNGIIVDKDSVQAIVDGVYKARNLKPASFVYDNFDFNKWFKGLLTESSGKDSKIIISKRHHVR